MANLEYKAEFKEEDLIDNASLEIIEILNISSKNARILAKASIDKIKSQGNSALYQGLINQIVKQAKADYIETYNKIYSKD